MRPSPRPVTCLHILRVFTGHAGEHGNPLGVFLDGCEIGQVHRQEIAAELNFSETVFVDELERGVVRLYGPRVERPFAGHAVLGTAWLLSRAGGPIGSLQLPVGEVPTWTEDDLTWVRGRPEWAPEWSHVQIDNPSAVARAREAPGGHDFVQLWSWEDELSGVVRARVFAPRVGVAEDEACGSASMLLCAMQGRALTIHHGNGSVIYVRPGPKETVELGGRVVLVEQRDFPIGLAVN